MEGGDVAQMSLSSCAKSVKTLRIGRQDNILMAFLLKHIMSQGGGHKRCSDEFVKLCKQRRGTVYRFYSLELGTGD